MRQLVEYRFGPYRLNTATRELYKGEEFLQAPPLVLNLLMTLLVNRGRVVTKDELIETLWPNDEASDASLTQAIRRTRQLLGDAESASRWIRTSHRVGYRFVGDVDEAQLGTASTAASFDVVATTSNPIPPRYPSVSLYADHLRAREVLARLRLHASSVLPLFVIDEAVVELESALPAAIGEEAIDVQLPLAWHLRQRDTNRALALADACDAMLQSTRRADVQILRARLELIRATARMLQSSDMHSARESALRVLVDARRLGDLTLACDTCWMLATLEHLIGQFNERNLHLDAAAAYAKDCGDADRHIATQLQQARREASHTPATADRNWGARVTAWRQHSNPAIVALSASIMHLVQLSKLDYRRAIAEGQVEHDGYKATGQVLEMLHASQRVGIAAMNLGDFDLAAAWVEPALDIARAKGWPLTLTTVLYGMGTLLFSTHQYSSAREVLNEGLRLAEMRPRSRALAVLLATSFEVDMALGDFEIALARSERSLALERGRGEDEVRYMALGGRARALLKLGRVEEAHRAAIDAIECADASEFGYWGEEDLMTLAEVHRLKDLPAPPGCTAATPSLHYLLLGLQRLESRKLNASSKLLRSLATEYGRAADYVNAYRYESEAVQALIREHADEASRRTIAMKVRHDTERLRAESEFHQQVAAANAQRAQALGDMSLTLERLSAVGRDITNKLNATDVLTVLGGHVDGLLDTTSLAVYMTQDDPAELVPAFGVEYGQPLTLQPIRLDDDVSLCARCAREQRQLLIESGLGAQTHVAGTAITRSALYEPLLIGDRLIGVATIQSSRPGAYGERERLVFRSLCAYAAIALDNANAYRGLVATLRELKETQDELFDRKAALDNAQLEIAELSFRDPLTGLRNRQFLAQQVERDVAQCFRNWTMSDTSPSAAERNFMVFFLFDIDHFKTLNETHGQSAGDAVLAQCAKRLQATFRGSDLLVRWDGNAFLIVATETMTNGHQLMAERACQAIAAESFELPNGSMLEATCSVGAAALPFLVDDPHALRWSQVVELASVALSEAKRRGRNASCRISPKGQTSVANILDVLSMDDQDRGESINRHFHVEFPVGERRSGVYTG